MREKIQRMERLDAMIRRKGTGNAEECSRKVGVSKRQLYRIFDEMRNLGAPIIYDQVRRSFVYAYEIECFFGFRPINKI